MFKVFLFIFNIFYRFNSGQLLKDDSYMLINAVGKGGFSEVYKVFLF